MDLSGYLLAWRTAVLPDREVIDALVHPAHAGPSAALAAALADWPGSHYWSDEPDGRHLVLTRPLGARRRDAWAVPLLLLVATLFPTTFVGAVLLGAIPFDPTPLALLLGTYPFPRDFIHAWAQGLSFSVPLLAVLLCHELGHYLTARRYQLDVSPPYFIPAPVVPWSIGTMGAFIRLRTVVSDRRQLLDVGLAGPIAGLVVALPALVIGFALSHPPAGAASLTGMVLGCCRPPWAFRGGAASWGEACCCCCRGGAWAPRRCWMSTGRCRGRASCSRGLRSFSSSSRSRRYLLNCKRPARGGGRGKGP